MLLPTIKLDDRRWQDLVEEGRNLIPRFAPEWTDHNVHDPGITLIELFAFLAEMQIFRLDRVPPAHRRKFLQLLGMAPRPPQPALAFLQRQFDPKVPVSSIMLPASVEFEAIRPNTEPTLFRTVAEACLSLADLKSLLWQRDNTVVDLTDAWKEGDPIFPFSEIPAIGDTFYLGFNLPLPKDQVCGLYFRFVGECANETARQRLLGEELLQQTFCVPAVNPCEKNSTSVSPSLPQRQDSFTHHSVRLVWEVAVAGGGQIVWRELDQETGQVRDDTRALSLSGLVRVKIPYEMVVVDVSGDKNSYYLRCRIVEGEYDTPPQIQRLFFNALQVEQAAPIGQTFVVAANAVIEGKLPSDGTAVALQVEFNETHAISRLRFLDPAQNEPKFFLRHFKPPAGVETGQLDIELELLGIGEGLPHQQFALSSSPVLVESLRVYSIENGAWRVWPCVEDFDASGREAAHFIMDATTGIIHVGDGEHGRVLPRGVRLFAAYAVTAAGAGNLPANLKFQLANSSHNQALLGKVSDYQKQLGLVTNPLAVTGGEAAEPLNHAAGRALDMVFETTRAVTVADIATLVRQTPGTCIARALVKTNLDWRYPCLKAPGVITVIIVPAQRSATPHPSLELRRAVERFLNRRRLIGTRLLITGPEYTRVTVLASVQILPGNASMRVQNAIAAALQRFLHPLNGGPDGDGWPLGRDVYRSEILQLIDEVEGVDFVVSLDLVANDGEPQCGNLCIGPCGLVYFGSHQIEVIENAR